MNEWLAEHFLLLLVLLALPHVHAQYHNSSAESIHISEEILKNLDFSKFEKLDASKGELTQQSVLKELQEDGKLRHKRVLLALQKFQRLKFLSDFEYAGVSLLDLPFNIGYNAFQESIHDHCLILELLVNHVCTGDKVLDIGTGTGLLSALFGTLVGVTGKVYTIEHIPELLESARKRVRFNAESLMRRINFYVGQGKNGLSKEAPFSAIYVGGSVPEIPINLIKQLKPGGRLLVPIKSDNKHPILTMVDRYMNNTVVTTQVQRIFIEPLRELHEQRSLNRTWENDYADEFNRNTPPTITTPDRRNYTGYYHTNKLFMTLYDLALARPNLFTMRFDPNMYTLYGTKPDPTHSTSGTLDFCVTEDEE